MGVCKDAGIACEVCSNWVLLVIYSIEVCVRVNNCRRQYGEIVATHIQYRILKLSDPVLSRQWVSSKSDLTHHISGKLLVEHIPSDHCLDTLEWWIMYSRWAVWGGSGEFQKGC